MHYSTCVYGKGVTYYIPEVIVCEAVDIALFILSLVRVTVAFSGVRSDRIHPSIGKGLPVQCDNVAQSESTTAHEKVADSSTEAEQTCARTPTDIQEVVL